VRTTVGSHHPGNVVLDLDGCLYVEDEAVPGAGDALGALAAAGFRIILATNNSTKTPEVVAERVESIVGHAVDPAWVITSAVAARSMLVAGDQPVLTVGEPGLAATMREWGVAMTDESAAAHTVVVGLDRGFTYDRLRQASHALLRGARFIATNPDATFPTAGLADPGAGSMVAAVAFASGRQPEFAGKPFEPMRRCVAALLGPGPTWVVGDRAETDLAFGIPAGWTTVLVMTGVTHDPDGIDPPPDHVLTSVADLPSVLIQA